MKLWMLMSKNKSLVFLRDEGVPCIFKTKEIAEDSDLHQLVPDVEAVEVSVEVIAGGRDG